MFPSYLCVALSHKSVVAKSLEVSIEGLAISSLKWFCNTGRLVLVRSAEWLIEDFGEARRIGAMQHSC